MQPMITIPKGWEYPRFILGERTKQGIIVGLEYYAQDSFLAEEYGQGWRYALMPHKNSQDLLHYQEHQIKTLSRQELFSQITAEIDAHQQQIDVLKQQLAAVTGGSTNG
ncbi:MAG: hypothetical protein KME32_34450 [Mojavia pulchra JT2-VF2]|jgi:hypothetical protein|uniref:Uncharacterized protein n=1 Tax=Mojavia pulchra JT2-VF2 TaxID=287848 RepID=A0A951UJX8_9NOST|nr:hypothetical protein [Mojavia pulchra JT2-VF2]